MVLSLGGGWRGAADGSGDGSGFLLRMIKNVLKLSIAMGTHFKKNHRMLYGMLVILMSVIEVLLGRLAWRRSSVVFIK